MDSYKRIVKENSLLYIILLSSFSIEVIIQLLVSPYQNTSEKTFIYFFMPLLFFILWVLINGIVLPFTSFRFSILFAEKREKAYKVLNRYIRLNVLFFMLLSIVVIFFTPYSKEGIETFAKVNFEMGNVQFGLILFQCMALYTVAQLGLNLSFVFMNKGILRGMLNIMAMIILFPILIFGSLYVGVANELLFWLLVGSLISLFCTHQNNRHFRTCEF